ncbi:2-polyprenyl-6-methoxyphenol hydroxylase [Capsulimonas corticalis]|uniref:2-polyprenyl-6-methoxyphenol hydroxylase n=1 Tax=Capsulimonas corticalis TaxID=2219043 RepID=A0A402CU48_9BACT|nr:FAD-dependent monooxygenase [Capsulimonas corticalis]BDI28852.1 2-polyprenyl-6-methoxyphenol hydroxylase [Capsulimonas corticalis]
MSDTEVLIVGAGPTGLVLALFLTQAGVKPRIIEKNSGPGQASRAMVVQSRTLEFYRQLGFADEVVRRGIPMDAAHLWEGGREITQIKLGEIGQGLSPYPFVLSFPQDDHERLLGEQLTAAGVEIEWETELVEFHDTGDQVRAILRRGGAEEECVARYLCGCDGAHSAVRQGLGVGFPGGTYEQVFYVADVEALSGGADGHEFNFCLGANTLGLVFPIRSTGMNRLIGIVPSTLAGRTDLTFEDIRPSVEELVGIRVGAVNWFSTYHVHHRVAEHFRVGRAFLAGDAGHIHSPAGGQGMNTGIGDAVNLAWKLAAVLQNRAAESVLGAYEPERIAFARSLVATTDRVFQLGVGQGAGNQVLREWIIPHLAPFLLGFSRMREGAYRLVSQTRLHYPESPLSHGSAGDIHGGDRLPWVPGNNGSDNFTPLKSLDWQVHIYGEATQALREAAQSANLPLHSFPWTDHAADAGLKQGALYLVRPDGYVALADAHQDAKALGDYIARFRITTRA